MILSFEEFPGSGYGELKRIVEKLRELHTFADFNILSPLGHCFRKLFLTRLSVCNRRRHIGILPTWLLRSSGLVD